MTSSYRYRDVVSTTDRERTITLSRFYSHIINTRRRHAPTIDEARRDYQRIQPVQHGFFFGD